MHVYFCMCVFCRASGPVCVCILLKSSPLSVMDDQICIQTDRKAARQQVSVGHQG